MRHVHPGQLCTGAPESRLLEMPEWHIRRLLGIHALQSLHYGHLRALPGTLLYVLGVDGRDPGDQGFGCMRPTYRATLMTVLAMRRETGRGCAI